MFCFNLHSSLWRLWGIRHRTRRSLGGLDVQQMGLSACRLAMVQQKSPLQLKNLSALFSNGGCVLSSFVAPSSGHKQHSTAITPMAMDFSAMTACDGQKNLCRPKNKKFLLIHIVSIFILRLSKASLHLFRHRFFQSQVRTFIVIQRLPLFQ